MTYLSFDCMEWNQTYLMLGSNLGERAKNLEKAIKLIGHRIGVVFKKSSVYETKPWGKSDQPDFLNIALIVRSSLKPNQSLYQALSIEQEMGRNREEKWGARIIDIDLLYVDNAIINAEDLTLPHPGIAQRRFVLEPLTEIAPDFIHPTLKKNHKSLLALCTDLLAVRKL